MITNSLSWTRCAVLFVLAVCPGTSDGQEAGPKQFKYEAITIKENRPHVVFEGRMSAEHFRGWFKLDYAVTGERVEIPKNATLFGTLVLTDGKELLVMPFYTWGDGKNRRFQCQGFEVGKAPAFMIFEQTEKTFFQTMRKRLETGNW